MKLLQALQKRLSVKVHVIGGAQQKLENDRPSKGHFTSPQSFNGSSLLSTVCRSGSRV